MVCFSNQTNRILLLQIIQQLITIRLTLALLEITLEKVLQIKDSFLLVGFRHNKRETCACIFESTLRCLQNLHAKMPPHMLLLEAEAVWTQYLLCKLNYMQFQHLLRVSCLHFSCVTVHFALREHETAETAGVLPSSQKRSVCARHWNDTFHFAIVLLLSLDA